MSIVQAQRPEFDDPGPDAIVAVTRLGDWLPPEELQRDLLARAMDGGGTLLDCGDIQHLELSALQVLLAFLVQSRRAGENVGLSHASTALIEWFGYVGATSIAEWQQLIQTD